MAQRTNWLSAKHATRSALARAYTPHESVQLCQHSTVQTQAFRTPCRPVTQRGRRSHCCELHCEPVPTGWSEHGQLDLRRCHVGIEVVAVAQPITTMRSAQLLHQALALLHEHLALLSVGILPSSTCERSRALRAAGRAASARIRTAGLKLALRITTGSCLSFRERRVLAQAYACKCPLLLHGPSLFHLLHFRAVTNVPCSRA